MSNVMRVPQIGDYLEAEFTEDGEGKEYWVRYWNGPIRDSEDLKKAIDIVQTKGMSTIYSKPSYARNFRIVQYSPPAPQSEAELEQLKMEQHIALEELSV